MVQSRGDLPWFKAGEIFPGSKQGRSPLVQRLRGVAVSSYLGTDFSQLVVGGSEADEAAQPADLSR